ncbi:MAG: glucose-6-phosphate dehydrogenase [Bacteroidetes bacterium]|nr:glucose-6-phosphate dehydrogenase [Bacteroidota bacterium]
MEGNEKIAPSVLVIYGGGGDLTWRKLMPALYNLFLDDWLPEQFQVIGVAKSDFDDDSFRAHVRNGIDQFSRSGKTTDDAWAKFSTYVKYIDGDFEDDALFAQVKTRVDEMEHAWGVPINRVAYLAVPPKFFELISKKVSESGFTADILRGRLVIEKPFGRDLKSAIELNDLLHGLYDERQLYRIDHYLGKETVQNILAFRFANALFEPLWNRNYIDHIQVTVFEELGVEARGNYYETAGALRDMIQNHLLQLLCLIAMEPPVSFDADEVRNKKVDVLHAIRKFLPEEVHSLAVRGQYDKGWIEGEKVIAYRKEPDVSPDSNVETFAALKFFIDNWRWQGVPIYMRTGKRMNEAISVITIQFKPVPHHSFPAATNENWQPNRLVLNIQPNMGIRLRFQAKTPGLKMLLNPVDMQFNYAQSYTGTTPEAYETLLLDVFQGDATLFMRADQVESAWALLMPVLNAWSANSSPNFPNYEAGSHGPDEAQAMIAKDGHSWILTPIDEPDCR